MTDQKRDLQRLNEINYRKAMIPRRAVTAEAERDAAICTCAVLQKDFDEVSKGAVTENMVDVALKAFETDDYSVYRDIRGDIRAALEAAAPLMRGGEVKGGDEPTADISAIGMQGECYVRIAVEPKNKNVRRFRISLGTAEILCAELAGLIHEPQPTPAPPCLSMPEQRVSDEELTQVCGVIDRLEGIGVYFVDGETCLANMAMLDLRDLRSWASSQKEARRQALEEAIQVLTELGNEYAAQADKNMEHGGGDAVRIGSLHEATVEAADRIYALIDKPAQEPER